MPNNQDLWQRIMAAKPSRRKFLAGGAALGCSALLASQTDLFGLLQRVRAGSLTPEDEYLLNKAENFINTTCLQCNTGCAIKVKTLDGITVKIDGNPYSPWTLNPHLNYGTKIREAESVDAAICPKGQSGIQTYYDPYRIRRVLKRAGKRGENKWVSIPFEQAVTEIVNGGLLFAHVSGEETRRVPGMKDIWALRDPKVAKEMSDTVEKILAEKDKTKKQELVKEFQVKFKDHLGAMIDSSHPDLGPKNNQFAFVWGRLKDGRGDLIKRFTYDAMGSVNAHGHTTVCQGSLYFTGKAMSEQWKYDDKKKAMSWKDGKKFYWQAELEHAEFVIFVGASPFEANYGPPLRAQRITEGVSSGRLKYAVIDPRYSKTANKAWKWVPVEPGKDAAIAMGMIRWILEHNRFDQHFLANANKAAAKASGESTWTNACWLVKIANGKPDAFLRASEIGFPRDMKTDNKGNVYDNELFITMAGGLPVPFDPNDEKTAVTGELFVDTEINGIKVKSVLQILLEEARKRTIADWAKEAHTTPEVIAELAKEFTSHGKKAVADIHRGPSQHTNGFYNNFAWNTLNLLNGNYDWQGGFIQKSDFNIKGDKPGQPYDFGKYHPGKIPSFGISVIRHGVKYEDTTLFAGYPAKRPWFPLASDIYQEVWPSAQDAYPYPLQALFLYMGSPVYALPGAQAVIDFLLDVNKLPLFVTFDITVGETSVYADYIIPDLTYLERWEFHGGHPSVPYKTMPIRQPAAKPLTEIVEVFDQEMPIGLESFLMALAEKMGLPGFGPDGFGKGMPFTHYDHFYLKQVANVATDGKAVPDADDEEVRIFLEARKHLPKAVFDADRWRESCGDALWRKVIYVLNRGGRFADYKDAWDGQMVKNKYGALASMYCEKVVKTKNAMNGKSFTGIATYQPGPTDVAGNLLTDEQDGFTLNLITYKAIQHTKSRTISNYWLLALEPENGILINSQDAAKLGLAEGDRVKIVSPTSPEGMWKLGPEGNRPFTGKIRITEGIKPGTIAFSLGYGHFAYGSRDIIIDGKTIKGDPRRGKGIHANAAMRVDPILQNTGLEDVVGGSICFYDSKVKLVKV